MNRENLSGVLSIPSGVELSAPVGLSLEISSGKAGKQRGVGDRHQGA